MVVDGHVVSLRFRTMDDQVPKYLGLPGETRIFNSRAIARATDTICITEGELDSIILEMIGLFSVGITGSNAWKKHYPRIFAGFRRVFIFGDDDEAGRKFSEKVSADVVGSTRVKMASGYDVNDLYLNEGRDGVYRLLGLED